MPITLVHLSVEPIKLTEHILLGSLQLYTDYHKNQSTTGMEINQVVTEREGEVLSCTQYNAKIVCSLTEVDTYRNISLDNNPLFKTQQMLDKLCEEFKDMFSLHQGSVWTLIQEIILLLLNKTLHFTSRNSPWFLDDLEMLEKEG